MVWTHKGHTGIFEGVKSTFLPLTIIRKEVSMAVPGKIDPKWKKLLTGEITPDLNFLAVKMLLGRLNLKYKKDPSNATATACITELVTFFEKNAAMPAAQNDLKKIFG
jgi:hypothetical protein